MSTYLLNPLILLVFLSGCLFSCSPSTSINKLQQSDVIVAFGDSLTLGQGVTKSQSYPAVLAKLIGLTVINAGKSGEVTDSGLLRLPKVLNEHQPKLVVLLEGGNDVLQNLPMHQLKTNLTKMIGLIRQTGAEVLLVSVPAKSLFSGSLDLYSELEDELLVALEDDIVSELIRKPSRKSDYIHFNSKGYNELAHAIYKALQINGAVP